MDELDMSVSRSWTKIVIASRYSSPVIVMLPSVAVPRVVLSIVSIVVMTEVAAAELTVTVFIWLKRNVDTVSVVAFQLPPGKCLVFWEIIINFTKNLNFGGPFSFRHKQDEIKGADILLDGSDAGLQGGNQGGQLCLGGRAYACHREAYGGD